MKISVHSDLHLEGNQRLPAGFCENEDFDVLILAGDIVSSMYMRRLEYVREVVKDKPVIYIPGNHEYYRGCIIRTPNELKRVCEELNIIFADREVVSIGDVDFVCCTGWADLESYPQFDQEVKRHDIRRGIRDFSIIANNSLDDMIRRGKADYQFIERALLESTAKSKVVVTHFAPTESHNNENYESNTLSAYFSNAWEALMYDHEPDVWVYGHTHGSVETPVYRTRVVCNQRGYGTECFSTYNPNKIIEV